MLKASTVRLVFGAGIVLVLALLIAAGLWNRAEQQSDRLISRSHDILEQLGHLGVQSRDVENSILRFINTADAGDLENGKSALALAQQTAQRLVGLNSGNPLQQRHAVAVCAAIAREADALFPADSSARALFPDGLRQAVRTADQAGLSAAVNTAITKTGMEEHRLLAERTLQQEGLLGITRVLLGMALCLGGGLILFAGWRMSADLTLRSATEKRLAIRDEQYRQVVDQAGDIIYRTDSQGHFIFSNAAALAMLHYTESEVLGRSYLKLIRQDKRRETERFYLRQFLRRQKSTYYEFPIVDGHGRERWIGQNVQLIMVGGIPTGFQSIAREITERKRAEAELQKSRNFIHRIAATTPGILYVYDLDLRRNVFSNRELATVLGYKADETADPDRAAPQIVHPDDQPVINAHYDAMRVAHDGEVLRLEYRARHNDGHWVWLSGRETPFERGPHKRVTQVVGILQDITARKAAQEKLAYQANYDALTGLPNRHYLWTRLQGILRRASIDHATTSLCLFDIDNFKEINDRFGHASGDEVLEEVGNIVRAILRSNDIGGRFGGDEFCFVLPGTDQAEAARVAERIRGRLGTMAFGMETGSPFSVSATFGVAESRPDLDAKELMEAADRALYRAKSAGRNRVCVDV